MELQAHSNTTFPFWNRLLWKVYFCRPPSLFFVIQPPPRSWRSDWLFLQSMRLWLLLLLFYLPLPWRYSIYMQKKHTTAGIRQWSPTWLLIRRYTAWVPLSEREALCSMSYGRMCVPTVKSSFFAWFSVLSRAFRLEFFAVCPSHNVIGIHNTSLRIRDSDDSRCLMCEFQ